MPCPDFFYGTAAKIFFALLQNAVDVSVVFGIQ
jgi:hypothetical protein